MDVQMPIMDGYRATHTIRHRQPYANQTRLRGIPIVAMTASAIQGDREKCKRAGMDDYLAKPVQGKTLEKMLVKWSLEMKKDRRNVEYHHDTTNSSMTDEHGGQLEELTPVLPPGPDPFFNTEKEKLQSGLRPYRDAADTRHKRTDYTRESAFARSSETENASVARRVAAEEKAVSLRDDKLLSMADDIGRPKYTSQNSHHVDLTGPSHALTLENIGKFEDEQQGVGADDDEDPMDITESPQTQEGPTSMANASQLPSQDVDTLAKPLLVSRPTVIGAAPKHESAETVRQNSK